MRRCCIAHTRPSIALEAAAGPRYIMQDKAHAGERDAPRTQVAVGPPRPPAGRRGKACKGGNGLCDGAASHTHGHPLHLKLLRALDT